MLNRIKLWFCRSKEVPVEPIVEEVEVDPLDQRFLFGADLGAESGSLSPVLRGTTRQATEWSRACQMRRCERPSSFTVMTYRQLDTDIRFGGGRQMFSTLESKLPIYRQYFLCDRCYDDHVRGKPGVAYVIGPDHVYEIDEKKETWRAVYA